MRPSQSESEEEAAACDAQHASDATLEPSSCLVVIGLPLMALPMKEGVIAEERLLHLVHHSEGVAPKEAAKHVQYTSPVSYSVSVGF